MRIAIAGVLLGLGMAAPASGGAWLRDPGTGFASASATVRSDASLDAPTYETSIYAEYGLRPGVTVGLDVFERPVAAGHILAFARVPLGARDGRHRFAVELGVGAHHVGSDWAPMYRAALAYGRGFANPSGGWFGIDAAVEKRQGSGPELYKVDAALGLARRGRWQPMIQIETAYAEGFGFAWALIPSLILHDNQDRRWVFGVEARSAQIETLGLKFALWQTF